MIACRADNESDKITTFKDIRLSSHSKANIIADNSALAMLTGDILAYFLMFNSGI